MMFHKLQIYKSHHFHLYGCVIFFYMVWLQKISILCKGFAVGPPSRMDIPKSPHPPPKFTPELYDTKSCYQSIVSIHYFPIVHNALCLPPKFCINYCREILLGGLHIPKSILQQ